MERRTVLSLAGILGGAGLLGVALFSAESEEEKIRRLVDELARAVSFGKPIDNPVFYGSTLVERFEDILTDPVEVSIAEVAGRLPTSVRDLAFAAARVLSFYGSLDVSVGDLVVETGDAPSARGVVSVTALAMGELRRDERPVRFAFRHDGGLRVSEVQVDAAERVS